MRALLDDLAFFHDNDLVAIYDRAQSVSNHNHSEGLLLKESVQGSLDLVLTLSVESRSCFIQEQYSWLANKGSSNRNALLLASRQPGSPFTDFGLQAERKEFLIVEETAACLLKSLSHTKLDLFVG